MHAPASAPAVRLQRVTKRFGELVAVDELDLEVPAGTCFGLLGPNGAGKSTLMSLLTGAANATDGAVEVLGMPMPGRSRAVRARTGLVPQHDNLDGELTCRDNLVIYARLYGIPRRRREQVVVEGLRLARLTDRADAHAEQLSGGMRRRLLIARGLLHTPDLVLLDEPTVGLDPQIRQGLWGVIDDVRCTGATVVLTTHYIEEAERLCDLVAVVDHGRLLDLGTPDELVRRHVGTELVVEVFGDEARQQRIRDAADRLGVRHRRAGTSIVVFAEDTEELLRRDGPYDVARADTDLAHTALTGDDLAHRLRRPANLEDVFVALTGDLL